MKPTLGRRRLLLLSLPLVLGSLALNCGGAKRWQPMNPGGGGWFERIGVGPAGLIIVASDLSGAYRSADRGQTWDLIGFDRGLTRTHVGGVAFDPNDADVLFLATDGGIFRSNNGGTSVQNVLSTGYVEHLALAGTDSNVGYAAWHPVWNSNQGEVHKTTDNGLSWQPVDLDLPTGLRLLEVLVAGDTSETVHVLSGAGRFASGPALVLRSTNGGANWTDVTPDPSRVVVDIALDPFDADTIWASVADVNPGNQDLGYLYRSTDRGTQWTFVSQVAAGHLWLDADTPGTIRVVADDLQYPWIGYEGIWESTTGGSVGSWTRVSSVTGWSSAWSTAYWAFNGTSPQAYAEDPSDPDNLYWVNSQFVYGSFDKGRNVEPLFSNEVGPGRWRSRGVDNINVTDLAVNEANPSEVYAAFFDLGTWRSLDRGESWTPINHPSHSGGWNGAGGHAWSVLTDPARPGVVWSPQGGNDTAASTLLRSADAGDTWTVVGAGLPAAPFLGLSVDRTSPVASRRLFLTAAGDVWRSVDDGLSWSLALANGGLRFTAVDPLDGSYVYAGGEAGLFRSVDGGSGWTAIGLPAMSGGVSGLPTEFGWKGVHDVQPDPVRPGWLYAAVYAEGEGLYRSQDRGTTWEPQRLVDNDFLRGVLVDPTSPDRIYVTSSRAICCGGYDPGAAGVLRSLDAGQSWVSYNQGIAWPFAIPIALDATGSGWLYVGSPGAGIHRRAR